MEFYNIAEDKIFYNNVYLKDTTFKVENEEGVEEELSGQDTYFLDKLDSQELKELGIANVSRQEEPSEISIYQEVKESKKYVEESNTYQISYEVVDKPLDEIKEIKIMEINDKKQEAVLQGFTYQDKIYQCSTYDQTLILGKVTQLSIAPSESISWIAMDNTVTTFTSQEFMAFATALAGAIEEITFKARSLKDQVTACTTKEEVEAVVW